MVKSLLKSPLTALFFCAMLYLVSVFPPVSETYAEKIAEFTMPYLGYAYMVAYGLYLSVIIALIIANAKDKNIKILLLMALLLLGTQWLVPFVSRYQFGEATGAMTRTDILFTVAQGAAVTLLTLVLAYLLFKKPPVVQDPPHPNAPRAPQKQPDKYTLKKFNLAIKIIVLPLIYCIFYFLTWYFLLWSKAPVQTYYLGEPLAADESSFVSVIVRMLLNDIRQVPMALIKGFLYAALLIPLLFQLAHKRVIFMITSVLLLLGPAVQMLIPNPVMPQQNVRMAHLIQLAAEAVSYGALGSFMLHTSMRREQPPPPPEAPQNPKRRGAAAEAPAEPPPAAAQKPAK